VPVQKKKKKTKQEASAFRLSDTMLKKCEFYQADLKEVKNELRLFGKIQADNNKQAQIYSIVGGNVVKINVELGDYVQKGQVLAVIRSGEVATFERDRLDAYGNVALAEKIYKSLKIYLKGNCHQKKMSLQQNVN